MIHALQGDRYWLDALEKETGPKRLKVHSTFKYAINLQDENSGKLYTLVSRTMMLAPCTIWKKSRAGMLCPMQVAAGGGGIPVVEDLVCWKHQRAQPFFEWDLGSSLVATEEYAYLMMMPTGVIKVLITFVTPI
ncbi:MAG: Hypothetical protein BHV28_09950 [Candidatus Tokpelaia hoelldobleri]|uniref:Uncharacterized protein n=1 Tax=Candidatus Tokpelaia hoelldobleri TaxID=1902579 RepID=A0A1U9JV11_9HYPH|nr:MAG: Hypothetical protein BHV28_09950 [Candidatus Tokpelaia hoelldoblerii]